MTAAAPSSNPNDANPPALLRSNRSYREAASLLAQNERRERRPTKEAPCEQADPSTSPECGSPPRYRPSLSSTSRCRSRSPPQPAPSRCPASKKAPRSVSPGGTAASSAGAALRQQGSAGAHPRRVTWAAALVASVVTRPRTPLEDVAALFYSRADEKRFRREAEAPPVEDEWCESLGAFSDEEDQPSDDDDYKPLWSPERERKDYAISKAVVVFGNSTRTYGGGALVPGGCALEAALEAEAAAAPFSFDDAAFWNGRLTWS